MRSIEGSTPSEATKESFEVSHEISHSVSTDQAFSI